MEQRIDIPIRDLTKDIYRQRLDSRFRFDGLLDGKFKISDEYRKFLNDEFKRLIYSLKGVKLIDLEKRQRSKLLSEFLNTTIGSHEQFRIRKIQSTANKCSSFYGIHAIYSGSRQEGFRLPGSDTDLMLEIPIPAKLFQGDDSNSEFIIHTEGIKPSFVKLETNTKMGFEHMLTMACPRDVHLLLSFLSSSIDGFELLHSVLKEKIDIQKLLILGLNMFLEIENGRQLVSSKKVVDTFLRVVKKLGIPFSNNDTMHKHGPCASGGNGSWVEWDLSIGLYCACCHPAISNWGLRLRKHGWPKQEIIDRSLESGFYLVPIGDKTSETFALEWRVSFCKIELDLINSFNHTQMQCYALLKTFLKQVIESEKEFMDILSSYFMKTLMFWAVEESAEAEWKEYNLIERFNHCIDQYLICWLKRGVIPHYFIPERNLLDGKFSDDGMSYRLSSFIVSKYKGFLITLNPNSICNRLLPQVQLLRACLSSTSSPVRFQQKELEQIHDYTYFVDVLGCIELPIFLLTTEKRFPPTGNDIKEILKSDNVPCHVLDMYMYLCMHAWYTETLTKDEEEKTSTLPLIETMIAKYIDKDVSSYRLCLATFHYKIGNYKKAVRYAKVVEEMMEPYVVHLLSAGLIETENAWEIQRDLNYMDKICGRGLTMSEKCKIALAKDYCVPPGSVLLPEELLLTNSENLNHPLRFLQLAPLFYSQFLVFLCHHHTGRLSDRDSTLECMLQIDQREKVDYWHHTYLILGICYEIKRDYSAALRFFGMAYEVMKKDDIWYYQNSLFVRVALLVLYIYFGNFAVM